MIAKPLRALIKWWDRKQAQWYQEARDEIHQKMLQRRGL